MGIVRALHSACICLLCCPARGLPLLPGVCAGTAAACCAQYACTQQAQCCYSVNWLHNRQTSQTSQETSHALLRKSSLIIAQNNSTVTVQWGALQVQYSRCTACQDCE